MVEREGNPACARLILLVVALGVLLLARLLVEEDPAEAAHHFRHAGDEDMVAVIDAATLTQGVHEDR